MRQLKLAMKMIKYSYGIKMNLTAMVLVGGIGIALEIATGGNNMRFLSTAVFFLALLPMFGVQIWYSMNLDGSFGVFDHAAVRIMFQIFYHFNDRIFSALFRRIYGDHFLCADVCVCIAAFGCSSHSDRICADFGRRARTVSSVLPLL